MTILKQHFPACLIILSLELVSNHWSLWPSALSYYQISLFACMRYFALQISIISPSSQFCMHLSNISKVVLSHFFLVCPQKKLSFVSHLQLKISNINHLNYVLYLWSSMPVLHSLPHSLFHSLSRSLIIRPSFYLKPPTAFVFHRDILAQLIWYKEKEQTFYEMKEGKFKVILCISCFGHQHAISRTKCILY